MALDLPLRLYTNYFQPAVRRASKQRVEGKVTKRYDVAQTPYERVLAAPTAAETDKERLRMEYRTRNPVALRRQFEAAQEGRWRLAGGRNTREVTTLHE
jgi:hypothetical protein